MSGRILSAMSCAFVCLGFLYLSSSRNGKRHKRTEPSTDTSRANKPNGKALSTNVRSPRQLQQKLTTTLITFQHDMLQMQLSRVCAKRSYSYDFFSFWLSANCFLRYLLFGISTLLQRHTAVDVWRLSFSQDIKSTPSSSVRT